MIYTVIYTFAGVLIMFLSIYGLWMSDGHLRHQIKHDAYQQEIDGE